MGVDIQWGLGGGNNALALFQQGAQMGQQVAARRDQKEQQNALLQLRQKELDATISERQQTRADKTREDHQKDIPILGRLLDHATDETSYQQARAAAASYGIDLTGVPPSYDPQWVEQQKMLLQAVQTPAGQQALSAAGKQAMDEGLQPGTPQFGQRVHDIWSTEQNRLIATQPGGGVAQYNQATGQTQFVIQPNDGSHQVGAPASSAPPPPPGFHLDNGGPASQAPGTFSGNFRGLAGEKVTSGYRTPDHNRAVGGVANSFHMRRDASGNALARDSVPPPGMTLHAYYQQLRSLNPDKDVILESDHVHMEPHG